MKNKLFKNVIFNNIYEILLIITPLITAPYISRVLHPDGVGIYSYTLSLVTYFVMLSALGTSNYGTREIARYRDDKKIYSKKFWEIEFMTIVSSVVSLSVWIILSIVYKEYRIYLLVLSFCILGSCFDIKWLYAGLEKFKYTVLVNSVFKILSIFLIFIFVKTENDVLIYILIYSISNFLGSLSMWIFLPKIVCKSKIELSSLKVNFKETLIYFIPSIATTIYTVLDKTLIGLITNNLSENGYYEQATKIINMCKTISFASINGVTTSRISFLYKKEDKEEIKNLSSAVLNTNLTLSFGCIFGIVGVANYFVPLFFGEGYEFTEYLIYIFSILIFVGCISNTLGGLYYMPTGKRWQSAKYLIIGSIINLILNLILIPFFSSIGAAVASIISETIISILYFKNSNSFYTFRQLIYFSWKKIVAGIIMFLFVTVLGKIITLPVYFILSIQIIVGVLIYFIILFLLKDSCFLSFKKIFKA